MARMRLTALALILTLGATTLLAHAAFDPRMTLWRLEKEVSALREAGKSVDAVATSALEAKVEAGKATAAMVIAGYTPLSVVRAMLNVGALPIPVCAGLLVAGVRIDEAREYFDISVTGESEACPPTLLSGASSASDVTAGVSGTGGGAKAKDEGPSGPIASPN